MNLFRFARWLLLGLAAACAGCASPNLKLYDGAVKPAAETARISMPEALELVRVNGVDVKGARGNWNKGDKTLEVMPGRYELLVYYREIWELGNQHDVLRSNPARFVVDAAAGQDYRLGYERPGTYDEARRLAADFSGWSQDGRGQRQPSQASGLKFRNGLLAQVGGSDDLIADTGGTVPTAGQSVAPLAAAPAAASASTPPAREWLGVMQGMWRQADAEERRAFLRWLAEQP